MAGKHGPDEILIKVDNSGGTLVDLSPYIDTFNGITKEALTEEDTVFGDANETHGVVGVSRVQPVTLEGWYDDTATTGPHAILNAIGNTRSLQITWGNSLTTTVECVITSYARSAARSGSTRFSANLLPTGAVTEA